MGRKLFPWWSRGGLGPVSDAGKCLWDALGAALLPSNTVDVTLRSLSSSIW